MYTVPKIGLLVLCLRFFKQYGINDVFDCMNLHFHVDCYVQSLKQFLLHLVERESETELTDPT